IDEPEPLQDMTLKARYQSIDRTLPVHRSTSVQNIAQAYNKMHRCALKCLAQAARLPPLYALTCAIAPRGHCHRGRGVRTVAEPFSLCFPARVAARQSRSPFVRTPFRHLTVLAALALAGSGAVAGASAASADLVTRCLG